MVERWWEIDGKEVEKLWKNDRKCIMCLWALGKIKKNKKMRKGRFVPCGFVSTAFEPNSLIWKYFERF